MKKTFFIFLFFIYLIAGKSQNIPVHPSFIKIYDYLDELANLHIININSIVKPYSRNDIYNWLDQADKNRDLLNKRQLQELDFYLRIYKFNAAGIKNPYSSDSKLDLYRKSSPFSTGINPLGLFYKDSLVAVSIKPILGINYYLSDYGNIRHTWGGLDAYLTYGKHWGMYASLRENNMTDLLASETSFVQDEGGSYKIDAEGIHAVTYSEMRGGITYSWDWGSFGLEKDHLQWGINYNGANIFSGRTPSFPMLMLDLKPLKWFEFHYYHGWLNSEVIDSSRSYYTPTGDFRAVNQNKYIAANMYTIKLWPQFHFSFGNSIIYSDINVQPAFLIPFLFFKSVDHTLNYGIDNENSQMFFALSSRLINHTHLYGNIFIDDFSVKRISDPDRHNFSGIKTGLKVSDWPVKNISITGEYTRTNPVVYKHRVPSLTFESNKYNLGHYLRDNSREWFFMVDIKPVRGGCLSFSYLNAQHGNEYQYINGRDAEYYPFIKDVTWKNEQYGLHFSFEIVSDCYLNLIFQHSKIKGYDVDGKTAQYYLDLYTPKFFQGNNNTFSFGLNYGF